MRRPLYLLGILLFLVTGCVSTPGLAKQTPTQSLTTPAAHIAGLNLPPGFQISVYARQLDEPRLMTMGPAGVLLVANRKNNAVVALVPGSSPLKAGSMVTLLSGLNDPTSLDFYAGYLYIGEQTAIARVKLSANLQVGPIERIITDLPAGGQHTTRTVLIGSDKHIYVAVGSDCNVCLETNPHRATVWIYNLDGSHGRLYSKGLRNAVGLAVNPWNQELWATDNGRDELGDNLPPDTLYNLVDQGDYGWPRCHAGTIHDPQYGKAADACQGVQQPLVDLQAHSAPLGLAFTPTNETQFPIQYRNSLYIAFHGSWNRTIPTGYKVVRVPLKDGKVAGPVEDFITGWLTSKNTVTGRPVGLTFAPDGSLFISDDLDNVIYHVWYQG
jgi:glucose/arabinose dehydrogenase